MTSQLGAPTVSTVGNGFGVVHVSIAVDTLLPAEVYEGHTTYRVDMNPQSGAMSADSSCDALWHRGEGEFSASFSYSDLSGSCELDVTVGDALIWRQGYVGIFVVLTDRDDGSEMPTTEWIIPVSVDFDKTMGAYGQAAVWAPSLLSEAPLAHAGAVQSALSLYDTELFEDLKKHNIYHEGDLVFAEHSVIDESLIVSVKYVWLSTSQQAADGAAVQHNLTSSVVEIHSGPGKTRFSAPLLWCQGCFLHVSSSLDVENDAGRRLALAHFAHDVMPVVIESACDVTAIVGPVALDDLVPHPYVVVGGAGILMGFLAAKVVSVLDQVFKRRWGVRTTHRHSGNIGMTEVRP